MLFILATTLLGACGASVTTAPLNAAPRDLHAKPIGDVTIYKGNVPSDTLAITLINVDPHESVEIADLIPVAQAKAADLGCDGLVIGAATGKSQSGGYSFTCVVQREKSAQP